MRRKSQQGKSLLGKSEEKQVKGQLSLFDMSISENSKTHNADVESGKDQKVLARKPEKKVLRKKERSSFQVETYYSQAVQYAEEHGVLRIGTAMRLFHLSAVQAQTIIAKLKENGIMDNNCRFLRKKVQIL